MSETEAYAVCIAFIAFVTGLAVGRDWGWQDARKRCPKCEFRKDVGAR